MEVILNKSLESINVTQVIDDDLLFREDNFQENSIPNWIIIFYFAVVSIGATINSVHVLALSRCSRNGVLTIVMQIAFADILILHVTVVEIITLNNNTWPFSANNCPLYKGSEILYNSLIIYFIIALNFHIISLWNYHKWEIQNDNKNPLTSCNNTSEDSNECLVTRNESTNRIVNIDYRKRKQDISIILPTILIWCLCLSLSIPSFTLSSTLKFNEEQILCAIFDSYYGQVLQYLLLVFRVLIPIPLFLFTFVVLLLKISKSTQTHIDNVLMKKFEEIQSMLIFAVTISALFIITSFQRYLIHFLHIYLDQNADIKPVINYKLPPLYTNYVSSVTITYLAMLHYSSGLFRAISYFYLLPKFKTLIKNKIFICKP